MNSAHSFTEGMDFIAEAYNIPKEPLSNYEIATFIIKTKTMDLTKRKEELEADKKKLEQIKADAHKGIIAINVKLRKLEAVVKDAEELFQEKQELPVEL